MTLFRLDASFRVEGSQSRAVGDIVEAAWLEANPGERVERRHIGTDVIPATAWGDAVTAAYVPEDQRTPAQREAVALAATLVDELVAADALLFAVPLFNFGVSQHFKSYVDLVITDPRMGPGTTTLAGKPAELVVVRGGNYRAGTPREGWDHATPWMRRVLADVWGLDLTLAETDFTLVGVNPALDQFKEMAAQMRAESDAIARQHGAELGRRRSEVAA
jgi:FMN-dependent NADH-azoreductase